jgi:putative ABC transport system permease protein
MTAKIPLAWCNLTHEPVRFGLFVLGIAFAVILMFVQFGFRNALLDSNTQFHDHLNADLVLVSPSRQALSFPERIPRIRLDQARSVTGVKEVHPMYLEGGLSELRHTNPNPRERGPSRTIRVLGMDPQANLLTFNTPVAWKSIEAPGAALYDTTTKSDFGPMAIGTVTELAGHRLELTGTFTIGTDFTTDGTLIMSEQTFLDQLRKPYTMPGTSAAAMVDLGLIRLEPGANLAQVQAALQKELASGEGDTAVMTVAEFKERERTFWLNNTPIGFVFDFGMLMGFAVGLVICYQILSGDVTDHLPEYATLKAMGYSNRDLAWVVLQEALILAVVGFAFGLVVSWASYEFLTNLTGMPMRMTPDRLMGMFVATVVMCCISAFIAVLGLFRVDPADVF